MNKELKEKNDGDLKTFLEEKREALRVLRFGTAGSAARDTHTTRKLRKTIAQVLTEINIRSKAKV